jgi:hypothetical protein
MGRTWAVERLKAMPLAAVSREADAGSKPVHPHQIYDGDRWLQGLAAGRADGSTQPHIQPLLRLHMNARHTQVEGAPSVGVMLAAQSTTMPWSLPPDAEHRHPSACTASSHLSTQTQDSRRYM